VCADSELCEAGDHPRASVAESFALRQHLYGLRSSQQQRLYVDDQLEERQSGFSLANSC